MGVPAVKLEEPYACDIIQYWLCSKARPDHEGSHVYFLDDAWYVASAYMADEDDAKKVCGPGRRVAKIMVFNYHKSQLHSHKDDHEFIEWVLIRPEEGA